MGKDDFLRFMADYFGEESPDSKEGGAHLQKVLSSMEHLQRRWWRSRTKRCLRESTEFSREKEERMTVYHRKDFSLDRVKEAIGEHQTAAAKDPASLLKQGSESLVSLIQTGDAKICVKEFRYPYWINRLKEHFRNSKGLRAWVAGNGLKVRGVASPGVMAYAEKGKGFGIEEGFLLMEASEKGEEMDRYLFRGFSTPRRKRLFIAAFARWLSGLHDKEIFHRDMKACNIYVSEEGDDWRFELLDLEDIRLDKRVKAKEVFRSLLQLNTSVPRSITRADRMRFYEAYCRRRPVSQDRKNFISGLIRKSKERGVVYVTPQGVVEERWG
jgi:serine/threonine protein kinase